MAEAASLHKASDRIGKPASQALAVLVVEANIEMGGYEGGDGGGGAGGVGGGWGGSKGGVGGEGLLEGASSGVSVQVAARPQIA